MVKATAESTPSLAPELLSHSLLNVATPLTACAV